jgi:hypothetical protein
VLGTVFGLWSARSKKKEKPKNLKPGLNGINGDHPRGRWMAS